MSRKTMFQSVQPRTGETHGLFGVRYLKHHNMRDKEWTADDLISQYEKLSSIFRKSNEIARMREEKEERANVELFQMCKKLIKKRRHQLQVQVKGDIQRTKNALQDYASYQKMCHDKQSYEVLERLELHEYEIQAKHDRYHGEKQALMKLYEQRLIDVANFQETIRYYDVKEFPQERDTKRLYVELKNSETRTRAIDKINLTYKKIIDQLLRDSHYYEPLMSALVDDWAEQTSLVQQTYQIGRPAIHDSKQLKKEAKRLRKVVLKEDKEHYDELHEFKNILSGNPKIVKELVRRDSDFSFNLTHYDRDTPSMTDLKVKMENVESTIKMLKSKTLCSNAEEIFTRVEMQPKLYDQMRINMANREALRSSIRDQDEIARFAHELLLDDLPQLYNDEKWNEIIVLEKSITLEKEKQMMHKQHVMKRGEISMNLRFAAQHILDVVRHVGMEDFYKQLEFPTVNLQLPLLNFNKNLPEVPKIMEDQIPKLIASIKSKAQTLIQSFNRQQLDQNQIDQLVSQFQKAMIDSAKREFRPKLKSFAIE